MSCSEWSQDGGGWGGVSEAAIVSDELAGRKDIDLKSMARRLKMGHVELDVRLPARMFPAVCNILQLVVVAAPFQLRTLPCRLRARTHRRCMESAINFQGWFCKFIFVA